MLEQPTAIYYKLESVFHGTRFLKKTGTVSLMVTIDEKNDIYLCSKVKQTVSLEGFLVCPQREFETAFANAMLKCEAMQLFEILGFQMSPQVKSRLNPQSEPIQRTSPLKVSTAQQFNQPY
jgi:hypothetical protein